MDKYKYTIDGLNITTPGKFELCPRYTPFFYECSLIDDGDNYYFADRTMIFLKVGRQDKVEYPELQGQAFVQLEVLPDGTIYAGALTSDEHKLVMEGVTKERQDSQ